ncbi:hypothetical protein RIF29_14940 [Crotalaria pallida]|uniref:Uncharacterized protein n=1 Tax=Crotalaria pallida TaxID=3830 RepID=A0AAN9FEQ8_CROPI
MVKDALKKQSVSEGDIQEHGKKNILGKALNLPEYPGRLRGAGAGVCKTKYFPPQKRAKRADVVEFEEMKQMMKGLLQRVNELENKNQEKATERQHDLPCHGPSIKDSCTIATHNILEGVTTCKLYLDSPMKRLVGIGKVHNLPVTPFRITQV